MKKTITNALFCLLALIPTGSFLTAQINSGSPIPVDFVINSPASIAGKYDYAAQADTWGPHLDHTVTGDVVWAYDINGDSLACDSIVTDLTGKMALIRRGPSGGTPPCFFSKKVWYAQQKGAAGVIICNHHETATEDGNFVIGMAAGNEAPWDSLALEVTIPAIFVSRNTCDAILSELETGNPVTASFEVIPFGTPLHAYAYSTPQSGIVPLEDIGVTYINTSSDTVPSITLSVDITDPNGNTTTLTEVLTDIAPTSVNQVVFEDSYLPSAVGEYQVHYYNSLTPDTYDRTFEITEYTYAQDNDNIVESTEGTIEPTDDAFLNDYGLNYHFGNFYRTGSAEQVATHVTFILGNPQELWTGDPEADKFEIRIYDADPDNNGMVPLSAAGTSYDYLDESGGDVEPIGGADFILTSDVQPFERLTVELDEPLTLEPNNIYLVMAQYNGTAAGIGIPPKYAFAGTDPVAGGLGSAVFVDSFYTEGWSGGYKAAVRLHLEGFTSTNEPLDNSKIAISPNPVSDRLRLELALENMAPQVDVRILDFNGRLVQTYKLDNVKEGAYSFDVKNFATGMYFLSVSTPEGFRAKKFIVER